MYHLPCNLFLRERLLKWYPDYMEQHTEEAIQQPTDQVELLGMLVAREFESVIDEMFAVMLDESDDTETEPGSPPHTRAAGG